MRHESGEVLDYLRAARRRWRLILFLALVVTATAVIVSLSSQKQYDATADLLLREEEPVNALLDPGGTAGSTDPERELSTNVELIKITSTAEEVRRRLRLERSTKELLDQISTETSSTSNIVALTARDPDPEIAAKIANTFAASYVQFRLTSARRRYTEAADLARRQLEAFSAENRDSAEGRELQSRQRQLEIAAALQTGGVEIVRPATVPISPSRPRPLLSGILSLMVGLLLGLVTALALELIDRRFKEERDIEEFFELPILAGIPRPPRRSRALDDHGQREAYGLLAANLRLTGKRGAAPSILMVTSPGPGEGKTSVSLGLARACSQLGLRVIVLEADLRRPAFSRHVDIADSQGLTGVVSGAHDLERELIWLDGNTLAPIFDARQEEDHELVGILPAGAPPANPQRVLSQPRMRETVERARTLADVVIVDTAPVGTVNDPVTMAGVVDAVVLIARLNQTTKDAARRALRVLRNVDIEVTGVVVTDADPSEQYGYYPAAAAVAAAASDPELPDGPPPVGTADRR